MKNFIAKAMLFVLVASLAPLPTLAAGVDMTASLDANREVLTVTPTADLVIGDDFTVRITNATTGAAVDLSEGLVTALTAGGNDEFARVSNTGDTDGYIEVTSLVADPGASSDIIITLGALTTDTAYNIRYVDSQGNFGSAVVNTGASNQVQVSAVVEPMIRMTVTPGTTSFGVLTPGTANAFDIATLEVGTNALLGLTVSTSSAQGGLFSTSAGWTITEDAAGVDVAPGLDLGGAVADHAGEAYKLTSIVSGQVDGMTGITKTGLVKEIVDVTSYVGGAKAIYTTNKPELYINSGTDFTVNLEVTPTEITPAASDYTDVFTFSVTGNF
jgi:hypothetical protein